MSGSSKMDWEKKFNSIIRDTDANLEKVKSRVTLSQRAASAAGAAPPSVGSTGAVVPPAPAPSTSVPGLADIHSTLQKHSVELRRLAGVQRRHELENEYVRAELVRIRRDVKKLSAPGSSRSSSDSASARTSSQTPAPAQTPASAPALARTGHRSSSAPTMDSEDVLRRLTLLEERVVSLQEQRNMEKTPARQLGLGSSPLACVDDYFPAEELGDVTPTENGQLTEPLGFNLDDLALSDSDDH